MSVPSLLPFRRDADIVKASNSNEKEAGGVSRFIWDADNIFV